MEERKEEQTERNDSFTMWAAGLSMRSSTAVGSVARWRSRPTIVMDEEEEEKRQKRSRMQQTQVCSSTVLTDTEAGQVCAAVLVTKRNRQTCECVEVRSEKRREEIRKREKRQDKTGGARRTEGERRFDSVWLSTISHFLLLSQVGGAVSRQFGWRAGGTNVGLQSYFKPSGT